MPPWRLLCVLGLSCLPSVARATEPYPSPVTPAPTAPPSPSLATSLVTHDPVRVDLRWPVVAIDAVPLSLMAVGVATDRKLLSGVGLGVYLGASPAVLGAYGGYPHLWKSLLIRGASLLAGGLLGLSVASVANWVGRARDEDCRTGELAAQQSCTGRRALSLAEGFWVGAQVGAVLGTAVDVVDNASFTVTPPPTWARVAPQLQLGPGGMHLGLTARF